MYGNLFRKVDTFRADNEFRFACPIFTAEVKLADCFSLMEIHKRGKRVEGRQGCQACIASSKCPVWVIERELLHKDVDPYFSATPKSGALQPKHVEAISRVIVQDTYIKMFGVPEDQLAAINEAHDRLIAGKLNGKAQPPSLSFGSVPSQPTPRRVSKPKTEIVAKPEPASTLDAAVTGDMSAAITKAAESVMERFPKTMDRLAESETGEKKLTLAERARLMREGKL